MDYRFFGRVGWRASVGIMLLFALALSLVTMTGNASSAYARGRQPVGGYVGGPPLTAQQQRQLDAKEAAVRKWEASGSAYSLNSLKADVNVTQSNIMQRNCITDPYTGGCAQWYIVSVGGQYAKEPIQEPDWCGPGAATTVALHWIPNTVNNTGWVTAYSEQSGYWGQSFSVNGATGWMANLAEWSWVDGVQGIEHYPSQAATTGAMRDAMNNAFAGGYYLTMGSDKITQESDLFGNATWDIAHDSHPMIFLVDASYLTEWPYQSGTVNHYIEGYAYGFWTDHNTSSTNQIYYADTASPSDYGTAGDYSSTYDYFWQHPWLGKPRNSSETQHSTPQVIIV